VAELDKAGGSTPVRYTPDVKDWEVYDKLADRPHTRRGSLDGHYFRSGIVDAK